MLILAYSFGGQIIFQMQAELSVAMEPPLKTTEGQLNLHLL
jgi:hypothetical protein